MARPKNQVEETQPLTEQVSAPVTYTPPPPAPKVMRVERQGAQSQQLAYKYPQIRGGICEYCGVVDQNVPAQYQYKLCGHYRGMDARCTYCPESKDPDEVVKHETLNVMEPLDRPGTLVMWCGSFNCSQAHEKRFKRSVS